MDIKTTIIRKKGEIRGYKVYINGKKYPLKPVELYKCSEDTAIHKALEEDSKWLAQRRIVG